MAVVNLPKRGVELDLMTANGQRLPVLLSVKGQKIDGVTAALSMIVTDVSHLENSKFTNQIRENLSTAIRNQQHTEEQLRMWRCSIQTA